MRIKLLAFLFIALLIVVLMCDSASANIRLSDNRILFDNTTGDVPLATLSDAYTAIADDSVLAKINDSCYLANYRIYVAGDGTVDLSDTIVRLNDTIPIAGGTYDIYSSTTSGGQFIFNNTTVGAWNTTIGDWVPVESGATAIAYPNLVHAKTYMEVTEIVNSEFRGFTSIGIINTNNATVSGNNIHDSYHGIDFTNCNNITLLDNNIVKVNGGSLIMEDCNNFNVTNLYINATEDNDGWISTAGIGITIDSGIDNHFQNIYVAYSGWSGIQTSGSPVGLVMDNITLLHNQHAGLDLHPSINGIFTNGYIDDSDTEGVLFTTNTEVWCEGNIVQDFYVNSTGGRSYEADNNVRNNTLINVTSDGYVAAVAGGGIEFISCDNMTVINYTQLGTQHTYGMTLDNAGSTSDIYLFDSKLENATTYDMWIEGGGGTHAFTLLGNVNLSTFSNSASYPVETAYYPNIKVVDNNGTGVDGAAVTFDNQVRNAWGDIQTTFYTESDGTLDISNRTNMPLMNASQEYIITASYDGETGNVTGIQANSTWFSLDPTNLQGDLITITLDIGETHEEPVVDVSSWITAKIKAQEDTEAALSLASMLPFLLIAATIIIAMFAVSSGLVNFESAILIIIVMLIVSTILMVSLPVFNGLYS